MEGDMGLSLSTRKGQEWGEERNCPELALAAMNWQK